jgi:hypothetical protein
MAKLTDTQLVILSSAAQHDDCAVLPLPKSFKIRGAAVTKTLESLLKKGMLVETPADRDAVIWRSGNNGQRTTLIIADAGIAALDGEAAGRPSKVRTRKRRSHAGSKTVATKTNGAASPNAARAGTKQALLIDLLKRKDGATVDEAAKALGWQAHSIRGAISGALKKEPGLTVSSRTVDGRGRVYRIAP